MECSVIHSLSCFRYSCEYVNCINSCSPVVITDYYSSDQNILGVLLKSWNAPWIILCSLWILCQMYCSRKIRNSLLMGAFQDWIFITPSWAHGFTVFTTLSNFRSGYFKLCSNQNLEHSWMRNNIVVLSNVLSF